MNKKNIIIIVIGSIVTFFILFAIMYNHDINYKTLTDDSGFDSSWDSGGGSSSSGSHSSGSSSSWGSSSSKNDRYDRSSSSSSSSHKGGPVSKESILMVLAFYAILVVIIVFCIYVIPKIRSNKNKNVQRYVPPAKPQIYSNSVITDEEAKVLEEFGYTEDKLLEEAYKVYVNIQEAWASNNIDTAKDCLSNELYNQYKSQLSTLIMKKQRNVMSDFSYVKGIINKVRKIDSEGVFITTTINVNCKDYLLNEESNTVERGDKEHLWDYVYELIFELHKDDNIINNCPNCNSKLNGDGATVKCEYCGADIVRKAPRLVMLDKKMTYQK